MEKAGNICCALLTHLLDRRAQTANKRSVVFEGIFVILEFLSGVDVSVML